MLGPLGGVVTVATEARRSPRYPLHAELEIRTTRGVIPAQVIDISREGMFIATREQLAPGDTFQARLRLAKPLTVTCIVSRVLPGRGVGLRYVVS